MASLSVCSIESCKQSVRALCICCQQHVCVTHLKEHSDLLNAQLTPLANQINQLVDQLKNNSLLRPTLLTELDKWRDEAHLVVAHFYGKKKHEFELFDRQRNQHETELNQLRNEIEKLIEEQGATQKQIDSIQNSISTLEQNAKQFPVGELNFVPLIIDDHLVSIHQNKSILDDLLPLSSPCQTTKLKLHSSYIATNGKHLLVQQDSKLCLFDPQLIMEREILWPHSSLSANFWSSTLAQFILISGKEIFTFDGDTMTVKQLTLSRTSSKGWWRGTCSNDRLFLSTPSDGPSIFEYTLLPSIQFVKKYQSPLTCKKDENIFDLSSNSTGLALAIVNSRNKSHLDLCSPTTLERLWSIELGWASSSCKIRWCALDNQQWMVINENNATLSHISASGSLLKKDTYRPSPWHATQLSTDTLVILTSENINRHQLS